MRLLTQPVSSVEAKLFHTFHAADSRRQFRTQQVRVGSFVGETADGCELLIDRVGCRCAYTQETDGTHFQNRMRNEGG